MCPYKKLTEETLLKLQLLSIYPHLEQERKKTRMLNYQVILRSTSQMHCMNVEKVEFNDMHTPDRGHVT